MNRYASPLALALARFARRPAARFGMLLLGLFILVAIYAPFLSSPVALVWWDAHGLSFPALSHLFNKNHYDAPHHLLFNVLALYLPVALALGWVLGRLGWSMSKRLTSAGGMLVLLLILCQVPILPSSQGWQAPWSQRTPTTHTWLNHQAMEPRPFALFAPVVHGFRDKHSAYEPPLAMNERTGQRYWFGSDDRGADVLARMCYGARVSLTIGLVAVGISMAIGVLVGAASGYFGGWVDLILQRLVELMMTFPTFILVL
ncbi:MAG: hypothetical protein ACOCXA_04035, partial [Planctomycetota bacterium]